MANKIVNLNQGEGLKLRLKLKPSSGTIIVSENMPFNLAIYHKDTDVVIKQFTTDGTDGKGILKADPDNSDSLIIIIESDYTTNADLGEYWYALGFKVVDTDFVSGYKDEIVDDYLLTLKKNKLNGNG